MKNINPNNERVKRSYIVFLKEAKQLSEESLDAISSAIDRFETYNKHNDFKAFHHEQAVGFKNYLAKQTNQKTGKLLSKSTINAVLVNLRNFFEWLYGQPGFKSKFNYSDASYFNLSLKDVRVAKATNEKVFPTIDQVKHVIKNMPHSTEIELRNRALVAFTLVTAARVGAIASAKIKHVNLNEGKFIQDAREINTKFSKTFPTYFFPVGDDMVEIVADWIKYLKEEKLWGNDDPLFPSTLIEIGESQCFEAAGIGRKHWVSTSPIRNIFKEAFESAGLDNFNPHSFRNTLVQLGETICQTPEQFKAWSQNLGHEGVMTTFMSYGTVGTGRQKELIQGLGSSTKKPALDLDELAATVMRRIYQSNGCTNAD